jgi:hypothetical protein
MSLRFPFSPELARFSMLLRCGLTIIHRQKTFAAREHLPGSGYKLLSTQLYKARMPIGVDLPKFLCAKGSF